MKQFLSISFIIYCLTIFACGNDTTYHHDGHIDSKLPKEPVISHGNTTAHTADYVCPLHCKNSGSDKPGLCPNCGLDYETLKEHIANGHNH